MSHFGLHYLAFELADTNKESLLCIGQGLSRFGSCKKMWERNFLAEALVVFLLLYGYGFRTATLSLSN